MKDELETIVVTGGAGFIGSNTVKRLCSMQHIVEDGLRILVVDLHTRQSINELYKHCGREVLMILNVDVSRFEMLWDRISRLVVPGATGIIHLAAVVGVTEVRGNPVQGYTSNVEGTFSVLELARRIDAARFVYASSAAVYGEPRYVPIDEDHPKDPVNLYGATKLAGEALVQGYARDYGLSTVVLRYFNVYGPGMKPGPYAGVVYKFIEALLERRQPIIYGDGKQTRDFVYVEDVAEANIKALQQHVNGVYNIGSGRGTSILELYRIICNIIGYCPKPRHYPPRPSDVRRSVASIEKAERELGWRPSVTLEKGLMETINYYARRL
ncbi:NAD-dependent epimerase/dehydratase family protein [Pyrodictium delaneyi]|uniref:NAD-dependent epimerase/dehydratase domain-containing protein n=1 Tax=Pyrodictium delaneyi TaxID=1273541 RepID=A0A211YP86_9CREN|nr:GDP-mannose 4,6-dehydratase [Pyrodictium delaneyi]OWJ54845.1 hypothetical protein Pdsh_03790 [Pyrodictium delaneyi]